MPSVPLLAIVVSGANAHDKTCAIEVLDTVIVPRPKRKYRVHHLGADKGYDFEDIRQAIWEREYHVHFPRKGLKVEKVPVERRHPALHADRCRSGRRGDLEALPKHTWPADKTSGCVAANGSGCCLHAGRGLPERDYQPDLHPWPQLRCPQCSRLGQESSLRGVRHREPFAGSVRGRPFYFARAERLQRHSQSLARAGYPTPWLPREGPGREPTARSNLQWRHPALGRAIGIAQNWL
jgi:hypothetical protein